MKKLLSIILSLLVITSAAFVFTGCDNNAPVNDDQTTVGTETTAPVSSETVGQGKTSFVFKVVSTDASEKTYTVLTDKETVGAALLDAGLIAGEDSAYGLYVKTVNGVTLDYDKDGKYWAFYINGEMAPTGVDSTQIKDAEVYTFKAE